MSISTEIVHEVDANDWNKLISRNKATTAHQMADIYKPYELAYGSKPVYLYVKNSTGDVIGQLAAVIHQGGVGEKSNILTKLNRGSVFTWNHGPIIHDNSKRNVILGEILKAIEKLRKENKVMIIKGRSCPLNAPNENEEFEKDGYRCEPWLAYISNIDTTADNFFSSLHNKIRYDIRKAEQNQLEFDVVTNRKELDEYIALKVKDVKNKDKEIEFYRIFSDYKWETLIKNGFEKYFLARLNDEVVGGIGNFIFNRNVVQHTVANSSNKKLNAGSFLTWNAIKWSIENKFLTYDMGGANPSPISEKEKGIKHYKSKWNGEEIKYSLYTKILNKTKWRVSKGLKQPSLLAKKIFRTF